MNRFVIAAAMVAFLCISQAFAVPASDEQHIDSADFLSVEDNHLYDEIQERASGRICVKPQGAKWNGLVLRLNVRSGIISGITDNKTGDASMQGIVQGQVSDNVIFFCVAHFNQASSVRSSTCFGYPRRNSSNPAGTYSNVYSWSTSADAPYNVNNVRTTRATSESFVRVAC